MAAKFTTMVPASRSYSDDSNSNSGGAGAGAAGAAGSGAGAAGTPERHPARPRRPVHGGAHARGVRA